MFDQKGINMKTTKCLLCGATAEIRAEKFPGYQQPETFGIYFCPSCNTSFSMPRVDTTDLYNLIYSKGEKAIGYNRYWRYKKIVKTHSNPLQFLYEAEEAYWSTITALKKIVSDKQNTKILEIGCGLGYLTYSLNHAGYQVTGLDISQEAIDEANRSFGNYYICADIFDYAGIHENEYDLIIMTELIEHIESPTDFLRHTAQLINSDGAIIITTPNKSIYTDSVAWNSDLPPVHCWWFSESSMKYMADEINCEVNFLDFNDYYHKKKPVYVYLTKQLSIPPRFSENGEIVFEKATENNDISFFEKIKYLIITSKCYKRVQSIINPSKLYRCKKRGLFTCAIYTKKE
jgi:SAM-dependent methyltransferase